ncbi:30S ribosomal protein S6e [Candidatus Woesearchaeota archaeon]|jgi:small subunit ribosomal protein S6e|nr:30S ribosomal protein S6e [Candidatus Woesearchaeota archaeon]|tara:strand:- start:619 stop:1206 length:588 start_codon:yes stop_codon:yes gene_type:complete
MEFKVSIGDPKSGKTFKKDFSGDEAKEFLRRKIGDKINGNKIGLNGYEFEITGGSDASGFPMRKDVSGTARKKILIYSGVGTRHKRKGTRLRRRVAGNTIISKTSQINMKVLKHGKDSLGDVKPESEAKEEAPKEVEAKPVEEKKDESLKEEVNAKEKEEEKPSEEPVKEEEENKEEEKPADESPEEEKQEKAEK